MIRVVTFCDHRMTISATKCVQSALKNGADGYSIWTPGDLGEDFKAAQAHLLNEQKGPMYWAWKPYIVMREMMAAKEGDIIVYVDAGNEWIGDIREAIKAMDGDCLFFSNGWRHVEWCKWDVIDAIMSDWIDQSPTLEKRLMEAEQVQASTFFLRVTEGIRSLVRAWYGYSLMPGLIDDTASVTPNFPTFADHRHDQSILGTLLIREQVPLHWFPSHTNQHKRHLFPGDHYPTLINHHRKRNHEW